MGAPTGGIIQAGGTQVRDAFIAGNALPAMAVHSLQLAGALRWEAATLMGWGFIDGEHPANPIVDQIQMKKMLPHVDDKVYAYRLIAVIRSDQKNQIRVP